MALKQVGPDRFEDADRGVRIDLADRNGNAGYLKGHSGPWRDYLDYAVERLQAGNWYYRSSGPPADRFRADGNPAAARQKIMLPKDAFIRGFRRAFIRRRGRPASRDEVSQYVSDIVEALLLNHRALHGDRDIAVADPEIVLFEGRMSMDELHASLQSKPGAARATGADRTA